MSFTKNRVCFFGTHTGLHRQESIHKLCLASFKCRKMCVIVLLGGLSCISLVLSLLKLGENCENKFILFIESVCAQLRRPLFII